MAILTISRMFGTGANELGELAAKRLGYTFFNNELIQMVAKQAKVSADWVASMEKEAGGKFQKFLSTLVPKSLMELILNSDYGYRDEEIYTDMLNQVITKIADEDNAVILGRGSQFILKDRPGTYHILLVADLAYRIGYVRARFELTEKQAILAVAMEDKRRVNLYRKFGKMDYNQTDRYHAVLNMSGLDTAQACDMLCTLMAPRT